MGSLAARRIAESDWTSAFGEPSSSIYFQLAHRGIRPAPQHRSRLALTLAEREEISRGIAAHRSARLMARLLALLWQITHAAVRCRATFDSADIAEDLVE